MTLNIELDEVDGLCLSPAADKHAGLMCKEKWAQPCHMMWRRGLDYASKCLATSYCSCQAPALHTAIHDMLPLSSHLHARTHARTQEEGGHLSLSCGPLLSSAWGAG